VDHLRNVLRKVVLQIGLCSGTHLGISDRYKTQKHLKAPFNDYATTVWLNQVSIMKNYFIHFLISVC
jgi:hypothetical protein